MLSRMRYAQVVKSGTTPGKLNEMDRLVRDELIPALQDEDGFGGAMNLVNRGWGDAMMIVFWDTREHASRPIAEYGDRFRQALSMVARISTGPPRQVSVWEVDARV